MATELRASQELVYLEQERSHVTLGSIGEAVISANLDLNITYMNSAAERLTLWTHAEALQRSLTEVLSLDDESKSRSVVGRLESILAGEEILGPTAGVVLRRRDRSEVAIHER